MRTFVWVDFWSLSLELTVPRSDLRATVTSWCLETNDQLSCKPFICLRDRYRERHPHRTMRNTQKLNKAINICLNTNIQRKSPQNREGWQLLVLYVKINPLFQSMSKSNNFACLGFYLWSLDQWSINKMTEAKLRGYRQTVFVDALWGLESELLIPLILMSNPYSFLSIIPCHL